MATSIIGMHIKHPQNMSINIEKDDRLLFVVCKIQEVPLPLAQIICTILDQAPDEDLLARTDEADMPRIDHNSNFFQLTEVQKGICENSLGIIGSSHHNATFLSATNNIDNRTRLSHLRAAPY